MKKFIHSVIILFTSTFASALPVGNFLDPMLLEEGIIWEGAGTEFFDPIGDPLYFCKYVNFKFGYYGDFVFNRHLRITEIKKVDHSKLFTNAGLFAANIGNWFDLYGFLGSSKFELEANGEGFHYLPMRIKLTTENDFSWGAGIRMVFWEYDYTALGLDAKIFETRPDVSRISLGNLPPVHPKDLYMRYREWQLGIGLSHRIGMFSPYAAVKWATVNLSFGDPVFLISNMRGKLLCLKNRKHFGTAIGVTLIDCDRMSLNIEARFVDERALDINAQVRF